MPTPGFFSTGWGALRNLVGKGIEAVAGLSERAAGSIRRFSEWIKSEPKPTVVSAPPQPIVAQAPPPFAPSITYTPPPGSAPGAAYTPPSTGGAWTKPPFGAGITPPTAPPVAPPTTLMTTPSVDYRGLPLEPSLFTKQLIHNTTIEDAVVHDIPSIWGDQTRYQWKILAAGVEYHDGKQVIIERGLTVISSTPLTYEDVIANALETFYAVDAESDSRTYYFDVTEILSITPHTYQPGIRAGTA